MKKIYTIVLAFLLMGLSPAQSVAETPEGLRVKARAGWSIGGTAPLGVPATIRSIDSYKLTPSFLVGIDAQLPLSDQWGIMAGVRYENKAMNGDVSTKAYHMELRRGESVMEGLSRAASTRRSPSGWSPSPSSPPSTSARRCS
jgi:hypothetical protein